MLTFGAQIDFQGGFFAKVDSIKHSGMKREDVDTSHLRTGIEDGDDPWMTFEPADLVDPGEIEVELQHDPELTPPLHEDAEDIVLTWVSGNTEECFGYMNSYEIEGEKDGLVMATAKLKLSGPVTFG